MQLGIVQSDVLAFVARLQNDPVLTRIAKKTKMVFPLYNEEVHLLGKRGIAEFDDLAGRRVAVGREGSGTYLTARLLFKLLRGHPGRDGPDRHARGADRAQGRARGRDVLRGRLSGELLKDDIAESDQLAVIPILNKSIVEFYPRAEIPAGTYGWQPTAVNTVAAKAVLVSFDFRRKDCDSVGKVAQLIATKQDWLQKNGHPKWKAVDLNYPLRGWEQYDCVRKVLGKPAGPAAAGTTPARTGQNPVFDAIKGVLDE